MVRYRPTFEQVNVHNHPNVVRHVAPLYYEGDGGVVIKGRTYEFLVSSALGRHIPYDPRKLPVVIPPPRDDEFYLPLAIARIYRDGYRGGTTVPRPSLS
jgi:hypothetical protein